MSSSVLSTKRAAHVAIHPWKLIENQWNAERHIESESLFALGNGRMGQRANHEETFTGDTLPGSYIAGVYYPDKTKVGWWKNGYPEYFAKVLNSVNWIAIRAHINGVELDLNTCTVESFYRELDLEHGVLTRTFTAQMPDGTRVSVEATRILSIVRDEIGAVRFALNVDRHANVRLAAALDFNVTNHDANWEETFWNAQDAQAANREGWVVSETKKTEFRVAAAQHCTWEWAEGGEVAAGASASSASAAGAAPAAEGTWSAEARTGWAENAWEGPVNAGQTLVLTKYAGVVSSFNAPAQEVPARAAERAREAAAAGWDALLAEHRAAWRAKWDTADIAIDGDEAAQQGIRFNIFHLLQTFTGVDERLNIGPKGFTGEKYGGSTYWDTEAYCLPFYLASADPKVARNLLVYRYKHLDKAIENAAKLGFKNGAALYPMVTMNGEECHNEWEITFEEIHRNGAIAYGIYTYERYTLDRTYLAEFGLEVLLGIARFWAQRVNWSEHRQAYVMLGVTGPNEYENNVNNNYYTNFMAAWCLEYAAYAAEYVRAQHPSDYQRIVAKTQFRAEEELAHWADIRTRMYYPFWEEKQLFLQQDGFLDKDLVPVADLDPAQRPINQKWSWDRILRSPYIKQADTLQGMFFFEDRTDRALLRRHFDFYEPFTVHESSLSPSVHTVLASRLGYADQAYAFYLRTARLDLDDYNHEVREGLHVTAMGGAWMSVVHGFGGMRLVGEQLTFEPALPAAWTRLAFHLVWRGATLHVELNPGTLTVNVVDGPDTQFGVGTQTFTAKKGTPVRASV